MNLHFNGIHKSYQGKMIFENISGQISNKDKIGLIGVNGVGKTTLAKILAGIEMCDQGKIKTSPPNGMILYIEQYPTFDINVTVYEEMIRSISSERHDAVDLEIKTRTVLNQVGFGKKMWRQSATSLSGGEKTKLALCKGMVSNCDLLILDEPTNHLDVSSYKWLEGFVHSADKPILVISHDRYFLDSVTDKIWELTFQGLTAYDGNYSAYKVQKKNELKTIAKEYEKQQREIRHLKQVISERKSWYEGAHDAAGTNDFYRSKAKKHANVFKTKTKQLERIGEAKISKPKQATAPGFQLINKNIVETRLPRFLVQGKNLCKSFGEKVIFQDLHFNIRRGEKVALIGGNGVGKTTLLKMICGIENYCGTIRVNPAVKIGYFAQELDNLNGDSSVLDSVLAAGATVEDAMSILATLLFQVDDLDKKIADLSIGEKGRIVFAKLILSSANLLVLDELTNYMDIQSKEKIEDVLDDYQGGIIFVSHDRYFIKRLANRVLVIDDRRLRSYDGNYDYYLTKCKEEKRKEEFGAKYQDLVDNICRLECELAFLGGQLSGVLNEEEKETLDERYLATAKELNKLKDRFNSLS